MSGHDETLRNERPALTPAWRRHLTLPLLLLIGLVLYELTAQPALGVAAICLKFGWEDFATAIWLRRTDPDARRASACFWLYLASGLWKAAITASIMIFAFAFLKGMQGPRAPGPQPGGMPPQVVGAILTALGGYVLSGLTTVVAVVIAWWGGVKLWLDSEVHRSRRGNYWPPAEDADHRANQAGRLVVTALILLVVPTLMATVVGLIAAMAPPPGVRWEPWLVLLALGISVVGMVGGPASILFTRDLLAHRVMAARPSECWGEDPERDEPC
jgi:hypothetical protein